jgi:DNA modification methylase
MQVFNGDCLEVMKTLPDKSVDLFICDLPYGCLATPRANCGPGWRKEVEAGLPRTLHRDKPESCSWDIKLDLNAFWVQVKRLCKDDHTPILMFCNTKFGFDLYNSNPDWFRYDLVWNKMRGVSFLSANKMPMKSHEMVYVFSKKGATYYRKDIEGDFPKSIAKNPRKTIQGDILPNKLIDNTGKRCVLSIIGSDGYATRGKGQHPTEKPVELYKWLIERYSKKDDTILDPTFGSGNSGRASKDLERKYIGIEKDEGFFKKYADTI